MLNNCYVTMKNGCNIIQILKNILVLYLKNDIHLTCELSTVQLRAVSKSTLYTREHAV